MKLRMLMVVALWAIVGFVMWFGYGMVGAPTHFMAFLFVTCCIVGAMIPALWESIVLVHRVMNRRRYDFYSQLRRFMDSDDWDARLWVDDCTYFAVSWNDVTSMWDVVLVASDGAGQPFTPLGLDTFYRLDDAICWVESKYDQGGYEMSDRGSIWSR